MNTQGRILIIRGGALSEFILTCPVFAALREQFPMANLEILGYPRIAEVARVAGLVDDIRSIETRAAAGFFARNGQLDEDLSDYLAEFSVIFSYLYDPDSIFQTNVRRVSNAQFIPGPPRPAETEKIHATDAFLKPLEKLAIFGADSVPRLKLESAPSSQTQRIAIHAGGDFAHPRNWSEQKWRALVESILAKTTYQIQLVAADGETRSIERLAQDLPADRVLPLKNPPVQDLARELATAQAFIGHDSGISHLAAATGVPCLMIWGSSNAALWQPLGKNVTILQSRSGANGVTQEQVMAALPLVWSGAE